MTRKRSVLLESGQSIAPKPGDVVKHYKGGLYIVLMIATDEDTLEERVIYTECKPPGRRRAKVWGRTMHDWTAWVSPGPGRRKEPRFIDITRKS